MGQINKTLAIFILGYVLIWGVLPLFFYNGFTLDVDTQATFLHIQNLDIKSLFDDKHPGLTLIVLKILLLITPSPFFANLLGSSIGMSLALIYIYKILRFDHSKDEATLLTILSSVSIFYVLRYFIEFNQNLVLLPIWIASVYYFISAFRSNNTKTWLVLSFVCALGMYAKFQILLIIGAEFLYLLFNYDKKYFKNLIMSSVVFILLMLPEIIGMMVYTENFKYMFTQLGTQGHGDNYGFFIVDNNANIVLRMLAMQVFNAINLLFIGIPVFITLLLLKFKKITFKGFSLSSPLVICGFVPLIVFFMIQTVNGQLPAGWLIATMSLTFPAFCNLFGFKITSKINFKKVVISVLMIHFIMFAIYNIVTFSNNIILYTNHGNQVAASANVFWDLHTKSNETNRNKIYIIDHTGYILRLPPKFHPYSENLNYKGNIIAAYNGCDLDSLSNNLKKNNFTVIDKQCVPVPYVNKFKRVTHDVAFFIIKKSD